MFPIRVGNYNLYPAFFILIFGIFFLFLAVMLVVNILKEKKEEHSNDEYYKITEWQRKHIIRLCRDYMKDNEVGEEYKDAIDRMERYMFDSTFWNMDEMMDIEKNMIRNVSLVMFYTAQDSYLLKQEDEAVLLLHAIDIINGGPDNPDYFGGEYPWIGSEVNEMRNHQDMTEEETRTINLWFSAVADLLTFVDEDLGKIPEDSPAPSYCKRINQEEMERCASDLVSVVDIRALKPENRDIVCKALFLSALIMINGIFNNEDEENEEKEEILYIDEYRRYSIRALTAAIDNQLYSDVIASIEI